MIHCIGDSHSAVFSGEDVMQPCWPEPAANKIPYFKSYRIGPATAYQIANKQEIIEWLINSLELGVDDKIMFCFGEVDIRAHLIKQSEIQNRPVNDLVIECVDRYINALLYYKKYNRKIIIWGPHASWSDEKPYGEPTYGTNIERNNVTKMFNDELKERCIENQFEFITIFEEMLNLDYTTNSYYFMDNIHLSQTAMPIILNKFKEQKLI